MDGNSEGRSSRLAISSPTPSSTLIDEEIHQRRMVEQIGANASLRRYPWAIPIGGSLVAAGGGQYFQAWGSDDFESQERSPVSSIDRVIRTSEERWQYQTFFSGTASVVFGRVRDATSVYEVMVLEDRLQEAGVIGRALSPAARERLAAITYERFALATVRERPARTAWSAIEQVLRDDGALVDAGLDGYSIFRAVEPYLGPSAGVDATGLPKSPVQRQRGATIGPAFRYAHFHATQRADESRFEQETLDGIVNPPLETSAHSTLEASLDEPVGGAQAAYHRPLGKEWQLDVGGEVMIPMAEDRLQLATFEQASLVYLVADRWQAEVDLLHEWIDEVRTRGATSGDRWRWDYGATVRYYLEDQTGVELRLRERQSWLRGDPGHSYQRFGSVSLGLVYRFAGWFDAPAFPTP